VQFDRIDINDASEVSIYDVRGRETVSVYAAALYNSDWSSGVMTLQVSSDRETWFSAVYVSGARVPTLTADGGLDNVYVGDVLFARLVTTTAAGASRPIEVRWI
jgi:hypothetical protein